MNPRADRLNRVVLTTLGLLLAVGGGLGLALSFGAFGTARARERVITPAESDFAARNAGWYWLVVAVVAALIALLAVRWLLGQLGNDRVSRLEMEARTDEGATTVESDAVTDALAAEVESYRGVRRVSARLIRDRRYPDLVLAVTVEERADLGALRQRIEEQAVAHVRQALGRDDLPVHLQLRLAAGGARVR